MTQITTDTSSHTGHTLPDPFSSGVAELFEAARPGIVQIRNAQRGGGTGFVWQRNGRILTNNHVVPSDQDQIQVQFSDGRTFEARVLERNPQLDLALLTIKGDDFQVLTLGDSTRLRVGEWVFAIGHPWGQRWTVTAGIVSAIGTAKIGNTATTTRYIQSDVQLAPGNSGGPLLDADGEVVGINAMIFGGDLAVAIPSDVITGWLAHLPPVRKMLGIEIQQVELAAAVQGQTTGLLIVSTRSRPESLTDLLIGDIVLAIAGTQVQDGAALRTQLAQASTGETVAITVVRGGTVTTLDAALVAMDSAI